jgi:hypothetical protein
MPARCGKQAKRWRPLHALLIATNKDADDPLRSFRVTLTALQRLLQGALTLGVSREMLEH